MPTPEPRRILVVDDEPEICWIVKKVLVDNGFEVELAFDGERGLEVVDRTRPCLVLLDLKMPGMDGFEALKHIKTRYAQLPVVILSASDNVGAAVRAMKLGAYDYISKPLNVDEMLITLKNALQTSELLSEVDHLKQQIATCQQENLIYACEGMQKVMDLAARIARYDVTVLIQGESGTGKELVAEYLHAHSPRASHPFVSIDCGALPESLVESELFGFERGAFTGAQERKLGRFELAQGGTLFLDEIGNLPPATQVKLLRVLQERKLQRLGGKGEVEIDVRILTATNSDLERGMRAGRFREDLYHRLNEFRIELPPLRDRGEDITVLTRRFLERFNRQFQKQVSGLTPEAWTVVRRYTWPGNVRELMNALKRAAVLATDLIGLAHLPPEILELPARNEPGVPVAAAAAPEAGTANRSLKEICQEVSQRVERETIIRVLEDTRWNKVQTAKRLKINYKTLFNKMKELGI
jgi:DNA-binding NtrC family response regulator